MAADLFYVVLFVTAFGSLAWALVLFFRHVVKIAVPFRLCAVMMLFYLLPFVSPERKLFAQNPGWIPAFSAAAAAWAVGCCAFGGFFVLRGLAAHRAVRSFTPCRDERILRIVQNRAAEMKMKRPPEVLSGSLKDPACVIFSARPKIILSEGIAGRLTERELAVVLTHELIHVKRGHLFLRRCFDLIVCIHWFNPFAWAARQEFAVSCETDCDRAVFREMPELTASGYADLMLKLLKLALPGRRGAADAAGTLDFLLARQRFRSIFSPETAAGKCCSVLLSAVILASVVTGSLCGSKSYFCPSVPGYAESARIERSTGCG